MAAAAVTVLPKMELGAAENVRPGIVVVAVVASGAFRTGVMVSPRAIASAFVVAVIPEGSSGLNTIPPDFGIFGTGEVGAPNGAIENPPIRGFVSAVEGLGSVNRDEVGAKLLLIDVKFEDEGTLTGTTAGTTGAGAGRVDIEARHSLVDCLGSTGYTNSGGNISFSRITFFCRRKSFSLLIFRVGVMSSGAKMTVFFISSVILSTGPRIPSSSRIPLLVLMSLWMADVWLLSVS